MVLAQGGSYSKEPNWPGEMFEFHGGEHRFTKEEFLAEIFRLLRE